jgi:hypothetical protein
MRSFTTEQLEDWVKRLEDRLSLPIEQLTDAERGQLDNARENRRPAKAELARRKTTAIDIN